MSASRRGENIQLRDRPRLERSPSGRATCAICGHAIANGQLRTVERAPAPGRAKLKTSYTHLACAIEMARDLAEAALASSASPDELLREALPEVDRLDAALGHAIRARFTLAASRVPAIVAPLVGTPTIESLLGELADRPDDASLLAVLGDVLDERGDLRAELIALQLAASPTAEQTARRVALFAALGPVLDTRWRERSAWGIGFVRRLELYLGAGLDHVATVLAHPSAVLLSELVLRVPGSSGTTYDVSRLAAAASRSIRLLDVRDGSVEGLDELVGALPRLARLSAVTSSPLGHPRVEWLEIHGTFTCSPSAWPNVTRLAIHGQQPDAVEACAGWLDRVSRLGLHGVGLRAPDVERLAANLGGRRLAHLDVTGNALPASCTERLALLCDELTFPDAVAPGDAVWVDHPRWGRGRLLRRFDGKLEVAFESGTKVLKASAASVRLTSE